MFPHIFDQMAHLARCGITDGIRKIDGGSAVGDGDLNYTAEKVQITAGRVFCGKFNVGTVFCRVGDHPSGLVEKIRAKGVKIIAADALSLAREAGNEKSVNVALIGLMTQFSGFDADLIRKAIEISVPAKFLDVNLKAFELGLNNSKL